jgi:hypothetical protein
MAEEFANFMQETKKAPLEEKLNAFGDIVERMMSVILKIPDLVDQSLAVVNQKISTLESRFNTINNEVSSLRTKGGGASAIIASPTSPSSAPPPSGGPPGGPPPLPGGPPGSPPGGPPGGPGAARPASPVSLRGAIMGELKQLFSKRNQS